MGIGCLLENYEQMLTVATKKENYFSIYSMQRGILQWDQIGG